jgi:small subunit ribosomal protein S9
VSDEAPPEESNSSAEQPPEETGPVSGESQASAEQPPDDSAAPAAESVPARESAATGEAAAGAQTDAAREDTSPPPAAAVERPSEAANPARPSVPGADLEVDIVPEGADPLAGETRYSYDEESDGDEPADVEIVEEVVVVEPIEAVAIDLAAGARYRATGKRKTAIARVTLRPGSGSYTINGRSLETYFPRDTLQRNIRQPLETVGYEERMDVVARMQGGGVSAQAGALRHGISRALLEADPNLRGELKRRGFLTRDARAKERKKAGLKKARKRPQFSKR